MDTGQTGWRRLWGFRWATRRMLKWACLQAGLWVTYWASFALKRGNYTKYGFLGTFDQNMDVFFSVSFLWHFEVSLQLYGFLFPIFL